MTTDRSRSAILVNFAGYPSSLDSLMPDNGLASLAGSLRAAGWSVLILDYATPSMIGRLVPFELRWRLRLLLGQFLLCDRLGISTANLADKYGALMKALDVHAKRIHREVATEIVSEARQRRAAMVGFKLWTGAGTQGSAAIARLVRQNAPDLRIYGGGPHAECFGTNVFEDLGPSFDAVALGEGEKTIVELGEHALGSRPLSRVSGAAYRQGQNIGTNATQEVDLCRVADPCYAPETYPALHRGDKLKLLMVDESRGCPYSCAFCFHPRKSGRRHRLRQPQQVVDLMDRLARTVNTRAFRLAGSNPPPSFRRAIAEALLQRGAPYEYVSFGHTRSEREPFELLRRSGCVSLFFGVESCDQQVLDLLNKRTTVDKIQRCLRRARAAGITTTASLIVPCPGDTQQTLANTVRRLAATDPSGVSVYLPIVVPGTGWFNEAKRFRIQLEPDALQRLMRYQVRFLMPPPLWDPLPYTLDGRRYPEMVTEASRVSNALESAGVLTGVNDSLLFVAQKIGVRPRALRDLNRRLFIGADQRGIERIVRRFNRAVGQRSTSARRSWYDLGTTLFDSALRVVARAVR